VRTPRSRTPTASLFLLLAGSAAAESAPDSAPAGYQVGARDELDIKVYEEADLSGRFRVTDDGSIDFPLLGRVPVNGMSADAIDQLLTDRLGAKYLVNPHVDVQVAQYASQSVQVLGSVKSPGVYPLTGRTTVTELLALAGGPTENAATEVRIQQADGQGEPVTMSLDRVLRGTGVPTLHAGEVLFVPEGQFVYVSGQVKKAGPVPYHEGLTVMQALSKVGGPERTARLKEAYVLRAGERLVVDVKRIMKGRDPDLVLLPDDQLYLDESVF
jgi:polysaccharide biosynthesis/export protein